MCSVPSLSLIDVLFAYSSPQVNDVRARLKAVNANASILLFGNLTCKKPADRVVPYETAKRFANERGLVYVEANVADSKRCSSLSIVVPAWSVP